MDFRVYDNHTNEIANIEQIAKEEWADGLMRMDIEGFAMMEDGSLILLDECGNFSYN
jgi:hypothetical protein